MGVLFFVFQDANQGLRKCSSVIVSELGRMDFVLALILLLWLGLLLWSILKIIKTTWVSNDPYKSGAIVCALILLVPAPNEQSSKMNWRVLLSLHRLLSSYDCQHLFVGMEAGFLSVCPFPPKPPPPKIKLVRESHLETLFICPILFLFNSQIKWIFSHDKHSSSPKIVFLVVMSPG